MVGQWHVTKLCFWIFFSKSRLDKDADLWSIFTKKLMKLYALCIQKNAPKQIRIFITSLKLPSFEKSLNQHEFYM